MEEDTLSDVSVTDVYDQAAGIGKEVEKVIETYGVDAVHNLIPKVIRALEQLEGLAFRYEKGSSEVSDLRCALDKLESEKVDKYQERTRFEEELVQIEESWQKESEEQRLLINRLQDENRRMKLALTEQSQAVVEEVAAVNKIMEEREIEVLTRLKDTIDKQCEEISKYRKEIQVKNVHIEFLQVQSETMVNINKELLKTNHSQSKHAIQLQSKKLELEVQLAEKEQQVMTVREQLRGKGSVEDAEVRTQIQNPTGPKFTSDELKTVLIERDELKAKLMEIEVDNIEDIRPNSLDDNTNTLVEEVNSQENHSSKKNEEEEELAVQGPINKEPYEKLYGKRPSGIHKFFEDIMETFNLHIEFDF